jgi:hypothetical protein
MCVDALVALINGHGDIEHLPMYPDRSINALKSRACIPRLRLSTVPPTPSSTNRGALNNSNTTICGRKKSRTKDKPDSSTRKAFPALPIISFFLCFFPVRKAENSRQSS